MVDILERQDIIFSVGGPAGIKAISAMGEGMRNLYGTNWSHYVNEPIACAEISKAMLKLVEGSDLYRGIKDGDLKAMDQVLLGVLLFVESSLHSGTNISPFYSNTPF